MRRPFPAMRKARLRPEVKAVVAGHLFLDLIHGKIEPKAMGLRLREQVGLQWTWLSCMQYLSRKEALAVFNALPAEWEQGGRRRSDILSASFAAAHAVGDLRRDGQALCASDLAARLKGWDFAESVELPSAPPLA